MQLNCQNYGKHMFSLPSLVANVRVHFPLQSKIKRTANSFCPMTCADGTLMFKTLSKGSLQCTTIIPLVSILIPNFVQNLLPMQPLQTFHSDSKSPMSSITSMQHVKKWNLYVILQGSFQVIHYYSLKTCKCVISLIQDFSGNILKPIDQ